MIDHDIRPHDEFDGQGAESYAAAWYLCPNVEVLYLQLIRDTDYIRGVFASPKYRLETLDIFTDKRDAELDEILELAVSGTQALDNFILTFEHTPRLSVFEELTRSNRSLSSVKLDLIPAIWAVQHVPFSEEQLNYLLETFLNA